MANSYSNLVHFVLALVTSWSTKCCSMCIQNVSGVALYAFKILRVLLYLYYKCGLKIEPQEMVLNISVSASHIYDGYRAGL